MSSRIGATHGWLPPRESAGESHPARPDGFDRRQLFAHGIEAERTYARARHVVDRDTYLARVRNGAASRRDRDEWIRSERIEKEREARAREARRRRRHEMERRRDAVDAALFTAGTRGIDVRI